jgi:hypothetical protein
MRYLVMGMVCGALVAAASVPVQAQHVSFGVKGGVVFASLDVSGQGSFETSADPGGIGGAFLGVDVGRHVRIQPEFLWTARRFAVSGVEASPAISANTFELPVLVQVRVPPARTWQATVFGGPQFGVIGSVTQKTGTSSTDVSDLVEDSDIGIAVGAGVERNLTRGAFVADLRWVIGTRNVNAQGSPTQKSRGVQLLIGYRF